MLTVNAPVLWKFFVVLCPALMQKEISFPSLIPPHAAFIAFAVPSSLYVARINTGCG